MPSYVGHGREEVGSGGGHENGGVFEGKQRVREEIDLVRDASVKGGGDENDMGSIGQRKTC